MLFNSYEFIFLFLPITFVVFFILGHKGKKKIGTMWLVLTSFFFYGFWDIKYIPLLFASICFNYLVGLQLENNNGSKGWLSFGIIINMAFRCLVWVSHLKPAQKSYRIISMRL